MVLLYGILIGESIPPVSAFPAAANTVKNVLRNESRPIQLGTSRIKRVLINNIHVLLSIEQLWALVDVRPTHSTVVAELNLTGLTLLGGHEDHTVGSTGTVNGCRSSILQHVDALDIVRVDTVEVTTCYTIDYIKR